MIKILNSFILKEKYKFRAGVTKVSFEEKSLPFIPERFKKNQNYLKNVFAQLFSSRLSRKMSLNVYLSIVLTPLAIVSHFS